MKHWTILLGCVLAIPWFSSHLLAQDSTVAASSQESDDHDHDAGGHADPVTPLLLAISIVLLAAKIGGELMMRIKQPAVLGELLVGVLLGNLVLLNFGGVEFLRPPSADAGGNGNLVATTLDMLARIGVILLLFEVGLDSSVSEMRKVGLSSLVVALLGVVVPFFLGWLVARWMLADETWHVHLFLGATMCATSVGITARVLKDLGKSQSDVAKIVLGAAVIDDVLGLIILAVVQAIIVQGAADAGTIVWLTAKAVLFLVGAVLLGDWLSPKLLRFAALLRGHGMLMITGLVWCFGLAWCANLIGLAPIVGAFAAGLILDEKHYHTKRSLRIRESGQAHERSLEDWVLPITTLLVPIFFVMMGFQVNLRSFADVDVLVLALVITVAAVIGKQVCSLGVLNRSTDRWSVGFGMIPRGEVGLIFAAIGQGLKIDGESIISPDLYSAIIVMVMVTTFLTPPLLSWSMRRGDRRQVEPA